MLRLRARLLAVLLSGLQPHRASVLEEIKGFVRKAEARTKEALVEVIGSALSAITSEDARGFVEHCGYRMPVQSLW